MPTVATNTTLPLNDHLVLLRKKGVLKKSSDKTPEPPQDQGWKIIREDAASLWGFQETPTARTAVREGRHKHSLCIRKALSLLWAER